MARAPRLLAPLGPSPTRLELRELVALKSYCESVAEYLPEFFVRRVLFVNLVEDLSVLGVDGMV